MSASLILIGVVFFQFIEVLKYVIKRQLILHAPLHKLKMISFFLQGGFCVSSEWSSNRIHFFVARDDKERDGWIEALNNSK